MKKKMKKKILKKLIIKIMKKKIKIIKSKQKMGHKLKMEQKL